MLAKFKALKDTMQSARHHLIVVAFAIVVLGGLVWVSVWLTQDRVTDEAFSMPEVIEGTVAVQGPVLPASEPVRIDIPTLGVSAPFETPLGLQPNNEIEVPTGYETVGYYQYGPTPGELGPAVVLGHVDSIDGPAVFYSLGQLVEGDEIDITRADGSTATFVVTRLERHLQSGFPTEQVYGNINHAGLRLITCSGTFDRGEQRYSHNLIVFAELKE